MRSPLLFELLEARMPLVADLEVIKDIDMSKPFPRLIGDMVSAGDQMFLSMRLSARMELWISDGTRAGTKPILELPTDQTRIGMHSLTALRNEVYFFHKDRLQNHELWKSDGTVVGTVRLSVLPGNQTTHYLGPMKEVNGKLFFASDSDQGGAELWVSDGTREGTRLVKDIRPGAVGSSPSEFTNINGTLFFSADDGTAGRELWKSDGTEAGTVRVRDLNVGDSNPKHLTEVNGRLYFSAQLRDGVPASERRELFTSDGTSQGTFLVKSLWDPQVGNNPNPFSFVNVAGTLYFAANDGTTGHELWQTDGTSGGTRLVKDIFPGTQGSLRHLENDNPDLKMIGVGTALYFLPAVGMGQLEVWKSDGTSEGTSRIASSSYGKLTNVNGMLYFVGRHTQAGPWPGAIWRSDGASAGTMVASEHFHDDSFCVPCGSPRLLTNFGGSLYFEASDRSISGMWKLGQSDLRATLVAGNSVSYLPDPLFAPQSLTNIGNSLYFVQDDGTESSDLWKTDGTLTNTVRIANVPPGNRGVNPQHLVPIGDTIYFSAWEQGFGRELWRTDGTDGGTYRVKDIFPGRGDGEVRSLFNLAGTVYFLANDGTHGLELWKTDGTQNGTAMVKDINPGNTHSPFSNLDDPRFSEFNGELLFLANDGASGIELWRSNGTEAGTVRVKDINPGPAGSHVSRPVNLAGTLFFAAGDGVAGNELWRSDGTEAGTWLVKDLLTGSQSAFPVALQINAGALYFLASDSWLGYQRLWKSDGTNAGTVPMHSLDMGSGSFAELNGIVYFSGYRSSSDDELWRTDGTEAGTYRLKEIRSGPSGSDIREMVNLAGRLYFTANDGTHGSELWSSDGTEQGTVRLTDAVPGMGNSYPTLMGLLQGMPVFKAGSSQSTFQRRLWQTDGTAEGTRPLDQLGEVPTNPLVLRQIGQRLFVSGVSETQGAELWSGLIVDADFDDDGLYDATDIDALVASIAGESFHPGFDLNGDGQLNRSDVDSWLVEAGRRNSSHRAPYRLGDANLDGRVDHIDLRLLNERLFTITAAWSAGDFNADGHIDGSDYGIWNSHRTSETSSLVSKNSLDRRLSRSRCVRSFPLEWQPGAFANPGSSI
jgi:ELWxxDGT repeat protein